MATKEHDKQAAALLAEEVDRTRQQRGATIARHVLRALGEPTEFRGVDVRPLWENRYRANVLVGTDITAVRIAHSYFLEADGDGVILSSTPRLARVYGIEGGTAG